MLPCPLVSTVVSSLVAALDEVTAERDRLRAMLRPLLADPIRDGRCRLCDQHTHAPDCPIYDADRLLGRLASHR